MKHFVTLHTILFENVNMHSQEKVTILRGGISNMYENVQFWKNVNMKVHT